MDAIACSGDLGGRGGDDSGRQFGHAPSPFAPAALSASPGFCSGGSCLARGIRVFSRLLYSPLSQ